MRIQVGVIFSWVANVDRDYGRNFERGYFLNLKDSAFYSVSANRHTKVEALPVSACLSAIDL
jgi:hypothetical protein